MKLEFKAGVLTEPGPMTAVLLEEGRDDLDGRPELAAVAGQIKPLIPRQFKPGFLKELPLKTEKGWLLLVGLGRPPRGGPEGMPPARLVEAAAAAAKMALNLGGRRLDLILPELLSPSPGDALELAALGGRLALYQPDRLKSSPKERPALALLRLWGRNIKNGPALLRRAEVTAEAVCLARALGDEPGNLLYPDSFARRAVGLARARGLKTRVLDEKGLARGKFNLLLAVGGGSRRPPRLVTLAYQGARSKTAPPVVLVGKGLTYDSGGLSLKPPASLAAMHTDMTGAAAVLAVILAAADLKLPLNLAAILPLAENMPGGGAYKVGDVHVSRSGLSVEITNTDAEGRLVLAEALNLAGEMEPAAVIDVATLTGACAIALGGGCAGLFTDDDQLRADLLAAAAAAGENLWPLPLLNEYEEFLDSQVADLVNAPVAAQGGAVNAALFLRKFVPPGRPWAHLDIAGPARTGKARPGFPVGASGFAVRTLLRHLADRA
ncbi:MAG: leucyl aminopeptidase family protein [Candidatus Adiutrix sp.]|jgi:leucyl aminopeptidase|nr:leucyl aminopeptidase family protein [Candidatus Adiutrix sp.]